MKARKNSLIESAVCTAVASTIFAIAIACGGGMHNIINPGGASAIARTSTHPKAHNSVFSRSSGPGAFLAALFFQSPSPTPTPTPSQLPESFEGTCDLSTAPAGSVSGLVVLNVANGVPCGASGFTTAGAIGNVNTPGAIVTLPGTIAVLKANVITVSGQRLRCLVTNGSAPVNDNDGVQPYYDADTNTVVLGVGTNQLSISCQVPVAAGDQAQKITVDWSKI